jgi:hypothetical protein
MDPRIADRPVVELTIVVAVLAVGLVGRRRFHR